MVVVVVANQNPLSCCSLEQGLTKDLVSTGDDDDGGTGAGDDRYYSSSQTLKKEIKSKTKLENPCDGV